MLRKTFSMVDLELLRKVVRERNALPAPSVRRAVREAAGVTLDVLAASLGVSRETARLWELGSVRPRPRDAARYREALAVLAERESS
jgi:DNA-binding transcriptional regulator YiaG